MSLLRCVVTRMRTAWPNPSSREDANLCRGLSGDNPAESVRAPKPPPDVIHYVESGLDRSFSVSSDVIEERGIPAACRAAVELPKPIQFLHEPIDCARLVPVVGVEVGLVHRIGVIAPTQRR